MGGTCGTFGTKKNILRLCVCVCVCVRSCVCGSRKQKDHLEDLNVDGRAILKQLEENGLEAIHCICVVQNRDRWRAFVEAEMNLHGSIFKFLTAGNCEVRRGMSGIVQRPFQAWLNLVKCVKR
jgi:hypothetical protein